MNNNNPKYNLSHLGLAVGLGLGAIAEVAKKSLRSDENKGLKKTSKKIGRMNLLFHCAWLVRLRAFLLRAAVI